MKLHKASKVTYNQSRDVNTDSTLQTKPEGYRVSCEVVGLQLVLDKKIIYIVIKRRNTMGRMFPTPEPCTDSKLTATHFAGKRIQIPCLSHQGNTSGLQLPSRIFFPGKRH